ncbi:MAG: L-histidine N(alpha)-methyltransferase [Bacteroidales bacterium]
MNQPIINMSTHEKIKLDNYLDRLGKTDFVQEIISGLQSNPKRIPSKFFYDAKGSRLFEEITRLDEYYPTRTEMSILRSMASKIFKDLEDTDIIELGSGDGSKMLILLDEMPEGNQQSITYIPVDFSQSAVEKSVRYLSSAFPSLTFLGITADFLSQVHMIPRNRRRLFCFLGSTLGNLNPDEAHKFLSNVRKAMNDGDEFLLGVDMVKDKGILNKAYNDSKGITAAFNLNILNVTNRVAKTNFNPDDFEHLAYFNQDKSRIEMHLRALHNVEIKSPSFPQPFSILKDETIHTENSYKYSLGSLKKLMKGCNLDIKKVYTDERDWFSVLHIKV